MGRHKPLVSHCSTADTGSYLAGSIAALPWHRPVLGRELPCRHRSQIQLQAERAGIGHGEIDQGVGQTCGRAGFERCPECIAQFCQLSCLGFEVVGGGRFDVGVPGFAAAQRRIRRRAVRPLWWLARLRRMAGHDVFKICDCKRLYSDGAALQVKPRTPPNGRVRHAKKSDDLYSCLGRSRRTPQECSTRHGQERVLPGSEHRRAQALQSHGHAHALMTLALAQGAPRCSVRGGQR